MTIIPDQNLFPSSTPFLCGSADINLRPSPANCVSFRPIRDGVAQGRDRKKQQKSSQQTKIRGSKLMRLRAKHNAGDKTPAKRHQGAELSASISGVTQQILDMKDCCGVLVKSDWENVTSVLLIVFVRLLPVCLPVWMCVCMWEGGSSLRLVNLSVSFHVSLLFVYLHIYLSIYLSIPGKATNPL